MRSRRGLYAGESGEGGGATRGREKAAAIAAAVLLLAPLAFAPPVRAQPTPQTPTPTPAPTPGSATPATTPIEATLFAYRALASDVAAIAFEIKHLGQQNKVVVGTAADLAPLIQWHAVIGEASILHDRATKIKDEFDKAKRELGNKVKIDKVQSGSDPNLTFTLTVTNISAGPIGSDALPVVVVDALPTGWTLSSLGSHDGWDCAIDGGKVTCSRTDSLPAKQPYPTISLQVVTNGVGQNTAKVSYGGQLAISQAVGPGGVTAETFALTLSDITGNISTFTTLASNLAGLFAVTETPTAAQVVPSDAALVNLVTRHLTHLGIPAYVPSVYSPNLLKDVGLENTKIGQEIKALEDDRVNLLEVQNLSQQLPAKPDPKQPPDPAAARVQSLGSAAQTLIGNIDSFENGLFGGQILTEPAASKGAGGGGNGPSSCPATCPAGTTTCVIVCPQAPSTDSSAKTQTPAANPSPAPSAVLPQILPPDLTIQRLCNGDSTCEDRVGFLSVRALEAGGGQLKKSTKLIGDRLSYSGGAVITFSLSKITGEVACSGIAYNYEGNIREKNYDRALRAPQLPAIVNTDFPCGDTQSSAAPAPGGVATSPPTTRDPRITSRGLTGIEVGMGWDKFPNGICGKTVDADTKTVECVDTTWGNRTIDFRKGRVSHIWLPQPIRNARTISKMAGLFTSMAAPQCTSKECRTAAGPYKFSYQNLNPNHKPKAAPKDPCNAGVCPSDTIAQVVAKKGAAYQAFAGKGDITIYEFDSVRVWFRRGKVIRVAPFKAR